MIDKDYVALEDMFLSNGWKLFIETADDMRKNLVTQAPYGAITNDQWQVARGRVLQLDSVLGFENMVKLGKEQEEADAAYTLQEKGDNINVDLI